MVIGVITVMAGVWGPLTPAALSKAQPPALGNGLARTPYMGWNTYLAFGPNYDEATIVSVADAMVTRGLRAAGYRYVWLDGDWQSGRTSGGAWRVRSRQWPHGMKWVADYIHSRGLLAGIYTDAGRTFCGGAKGASWGHYRQDANQFAAWGYDALKVDFCGGRKMRLDPREAYGAFGYALRHNARRRRMLFNICNNSPPNRYGPNNPPYKRSAFYSYAFGPRIANSWRTDADIGSPRNVVFRNVLRTLYRDAAHPEAAGPGHWNDPDYLAPELGMSDTEAQTQFTMWAVVAAPLILGNDVRTMSPTTQAMVTNREVIAIDQDTRGVQGRRIAQHGSGDAWVKPLANGDRAVALLNRGNVPMTISASSVELGLAPSSRYQVRDVWTHHTTTTPRAIAAIVPPHGAVLYRVSAQ